MNYQRFHTDLRWYNTRMAVRISVFLVLVGVILLASKSQFNALWTMLAISMGLTLVAIYRDMGNRCTYVVESGRLILKRRGEVRVIPVDTILDASPIDRVEAREYFRSVVLGRRKTRRERAELKRIFLRYCTVAIGISPLDPGAWNGMGAGVKRSDLVLVRTTDGSVRLLSPHYAMDLISALTRHSFEEPPAGA